MRSLSRREFIQGSMAGLAAGGLLGTKTEARANRGRTGTSSTKPNIVIIVVDQMSMDTISAYQEHMTHPAWGVHWLHTPHLDRMVRNGTSFMKSYTANPVCSPGRSSLFTGRTTLETGVIWNNIGIAKNVPNMGQWLQDHTDYLPIYAGKWHAGGPWNNPSVSGSRKIPGFETMPIGGIPTGDLMDPQISGSLDAFLRTYRESRAFLIVGGFMNPHDICFYPGNTAKDRFFEKKDLPVMPPNNTVTQSWCEGQNIKSYDELTWRSYRYDYYRMVEMVDAEIGKVLDAVDSRPDADNTIVFFTADHGDAAACHSRKGKTTPFEESARVPLIAYCPGRIQAGILDDTHLASGLDLMSTVCDYAGIAAPEHMRGYSLKGILEGQTPTQWRDFIYCEYHWTGRMIRTNRYKYIMSYSRNNDMDRPFKLKSGGNSQWINGRGDLFKTSSSYGFFDLDTDPWEMNNLANKSQYAALINEHQDRLRDLEAVLIQNDYYTRK